MDIKELQKTWDAFGKTHPFWSILTSAGKWDMEEFFKVGQSDIDGIMVYIDSLGIPLPRKKALDFGCGAGRLTQALAKHFDEAYGVDIALSMIELARELNQHGDQCKFFVNDKDDLSLFESNSFDFVYTTLVLQHMQPKYSKSYIKEFLRIIRRDGLVIFHQPAEPINNTNAALRGLKAATEPLPDSAFKAKIHVVNPPSTLKPGTQYLVIAEVTNLSDTTWPASGDIRGHYRVQLGNHWRKSNGSMLSMDDEHTTLLHDLKPQETMELPIAVNAPKEEGTYILELDLVQEAVAWFQEKGSPPAHITVKNRNDNKAGFTRLLNKIFAAPNKAKPADAETLKEPAEAAPRMQMYGVPQQEIIELVERAGGKIVDIQDDKSAGQDWLCYRYCVTK